MQRRPLHRVRLAVLLASLLLGSSTAAAQIEAIQGPHRDAHAKKRETAVRRAREQAVPPERIDALTRRIMEDPTGDHLRRTGRWRTDEVRAQGERLTESNLSERAVQRDIAAAPLQARLKLFRELADQERGAEVRTFERRLRGMLYSEGSENVSSPKKKFFEVTEETFDLLPKVMGENVVWFAVTPRPGHLHTLIADQAGGPNFTHNTYGSGRFTEASLPSGRSERRSKQYLLPVQLTGKEMDRFVRYLNAGIEHGKTKVYGFRRSNGEWVCRTKCTNWATSAPIGKLEGWIREVDSQVQRAVRDGRLDAKFSDGLHKALAQAENPEQRSELVNEIVQSERISQTTKDEAQRLEQRFDEVLERFPRRPKDLVGREALAHTLGLGRSQDPAKWTYDLLMSKRVPLVGVATGQPAENFSETTFDMEIMGEVDQQGRVVDNPNYNRNRVDNERYGEREPGALGKVPEGHSTALEAE